MARRHRLPLPVYRSGKIGWVLDAIPDWDGLLVLEDGGGAGLYVRFWEEAGATVVCMDPDPDQLATRAFVTGSALSLPFRSGAFQAVLFLDVLEHIPRGTELAALTEIRRVLAPNGALVLITPSAHLRSRLTDPLWPFGHRHYSVDSVVRLLSEAELHVERATIRGAGFSVARVLLLYGFKWLLGRPIPRAFDDWLGVRLDREWRREGFMQVVATARRLGPPESGRRQQARGQTARVGRQTPGPLDAASSATS